MHHVVTTEADLLGRMPFAPQPQLDVSNPISAWPGLRDRIQTALETPDEAMYTYDGYFGPTNFASTVDQFYSMDLVVHCWDLARATGMSDYEPIDPAEMTRIPAEFASMAATMRQPGLFGDQVAVPDSADDQTRFLAFTGRRA